MTVTRKETGPNRYRETFGRHYEDFRVGDVYEHRPGRTLTEADNINFTLQTMNTHPLHFDAAYAAKTEFKRPVINSTLRGIIEAASDYDQIGTVFGARHGAGEAHHHGVRPAPPDGRVPGGVAE